MEATAIEKAAPLTQEATATAPPILHHYAAIHYKKHRQQPQGHAMGAITNDFKRKGHAERYTAQKLLESFSAGQCILLSNFEIDRENRIRFLSSSAFAIDVDDDHETTEPLRVLENLKDICTGLFYTFSHGKKGNRYRLFFQLDQSITDQDELNALIDYMIHFLKEKGLPVDGQAKSPTAIIRGGVAGYEINDLTTALKVTEWLPKAKQRAAERLQRLEEQRKQKADQLKDTMQNPVTFEELREMCETIGHIPTGSGEENAQKWKQIILALKYQVQIGLLDDQQGYELFDIISGGESGEKVWHGLKPSGFVTVATIVHHAQQAGYKRKHKHSYALLEAAEPIETERLPSKGHLSAELAKDLLKRRERLLVDSPTGSGKTSSFMNAFKELANWDYHFYIFTAPTIPLTEQIAKDHEVMAITGGMQNLRNKVINKALSGERVFVATYDKTAELVSYLSQGIDYGDKQPEFSIVIDEVHKFTEAYNYRFAAIDRLEELTQVAVSLVGLSGTPEDILKDNFDKLIQIETGNKKSPCSDYRVFTYNKKSDANIMIIPVIRGLLQQTRVLLFINSKKRINSIAAALKKEGIRTQIITSDTKQSQTYLNIVESGTIDDSVQVVISTTVLADGISINNNLNWSCVVVADMAAPIFNPSTIKQISNRFRNQYRYFGLYMQKTNPKFSEAKRFYIESEYRYQKKVVERYVDYLNTEFDGEQLKNFLPSKVERHNGIYYKSTDETAAVAFNPLFVRHQSMKKKEKHYGLFRNAFIEEVGRQLEHKCTGVFNVNEEVEKNGSDLSGLIAEVEAEQEREKLEAAELRAAFSIHFDESIYNCFVRGDEEALKLFKKDVHPDQYAATLKNCTIADYETCKQIGEALNRKTDRYKYFNDMKALADIATFEHVKKTTVTKRVFNELLKLEGETYFSADFKELVEKKIPKKLKVKPSDVKEALQLFHKFSTRAGGVSFATIRPLSVELVAKVRHNLDEQKVKNSLLQYVWQRNPQQQKILLPALLEKWGIEKYIK